MKTPPTTAVHEAIDSAYERLVATLPEHLATIARELPYRFGLTPNPGTPWSRVFNNAAVLGFPALLLGAERASRKIRERAVEAHLFAIIAAFGMDRIDDGQIIAGAAERALIHIVRRARDQALAPLLASAPEGACTFAWGEQVTAESVEEERAVFAGCAPATLDRYRAISLKKQGLAFPASMTATAAAGWSAEERRHVEALVAGAALGLQYRDDVVDWIDDFELGASWHVALLEHAPAEATVEALEQQLHAEGGLVRFLEMSSEAFHQAGVAAEALGAAALAAWAHSQAEQTAVLAEREAQSPGFAVRWERTRRAQREQQQAMLAEQPVARAAG
ncbi:hypothetical protein [Polyangium mundeleinium]|uniref:Uncharacterized protein n=1 Tax=Polyangium mundeleinium TaxID=2995306 RepID=A0ABT5EUB2_9BACT|nr:hypothetical protein [Polyangium mundeleinium]MDC0744944.1 hypothetical protein [Polyangium mundeleinium]